MIRAFFKTAGLVLLTLALLPPYGIAYPFGHDARNVIIRAWHRAVCVILGLKVVQQGRPIVGDGNLFVANHSSYLDIPVLGSRVNAMFVAKTEVSGWPMFGVLARLANTVFIERKAGRAKVQARLFRALLSRGEKLLLFPEGTSTDNTCVARFKSSLFQGVVDNARKDTTFVQPVTIAYLFTADGEPMGADEREGYVWYGGHGFFDHLGALLKGPGCEIHILFHDPVPVRFFTCRKDLARHLEHTVRLGHIALSGRAHYPEEEPGDVVPALS